MADILNILILAIAVGGSLAILNLLPLDGTVKRIATIVILCIGGVIALKWLILYLGGR